MGNLTATDASALQCIGNTPLVTLKRITQGKPFDIHAKLEFLNPSGSIKDRIALRMIQDARQEGKLSKRGTIVEASTGNTAIALAFVGAVLGHKVQIFVPEKTAVRERLETIRRLGAKIVATQCDGDTEGDAGGVHGAWYEIAGRIEAKKIESIPDVWWSRQFNNPSNVAAHRDGTGREILQQMGGEIDAFVASVGTGGTFVGVQQALRNTCRMFVAVEPEYRARLVPGGLDKYPCIPGVTDGILYTAGLEGLADEVVTLETEEARAMCHRLMKEEGLLCGISGGANVLAAMRIGETHPEVKEIATVLPDSHSRYFSQEIYTT